MPYDPRQMQQIGRMGIGMMAPEPSPFQQQQQRPLEWWEQPLPQRKDQPAQDKDPRQDPKQPPQPSLLQMLMLGGKPTYSGTPQPTSGSYGAIPGDPWGWLGSVGRPSR